MITKKCVVLSMLTLTSVKVFVCFVVKEMFSKHLEEGHYSNFIIIFEKPLPNVKFGIRLASCKV